MTLTIPDARLLAVMEPCKDAGTGKEDEADTVRNALAQPIGSPALAELAKGKRRITMITSDHTRPMPSRITMPVLLEEIRRGAPAAELTILVATGLHRATTQEELAERFGAEIVAHERVIVHDCRDTQNLRQLGNLPSGGSLTLSAYATEADLLVAEGFIEPHFFAGFSGGRKSVLPGVAGYDSVVYNHCADFIADPRARTGVLHGNPIHEDMVYAAKAAGLAFLLNVLLDDRHRIVDAVAGDAALAHEEGCRRLTAQAAVPAKKAPIVITSNGGYPLDQNIYQMVKCMDTAAQCCEDGGVIIAVGECRDGHGGEAFFQDFAGREDPKILTARFQSRSRAETKTDQWQSQILARILTRCRVILVSPGQQELTLAMGLCWAANAEEALLQAGSLIGDPYAEIVYIPVGVGIVTGNAESDCG
jgi:nickel-dependent lactate racemase